MTLTSRDSRASDVLQVQEVPERRASFAVVQQRHAGVSAGVERGAHLLDRGAVRLRALQEAAVDADALSPRVAGQLEEAIADVRHLGVDVEIILTRSCIFCIKNH
jgi:hypothetical protein